MRFCLSLVVLASSLVASAETLLELPVSATANTAYLTSMSERPWWNKAWKRRAPLLVSSRSEVSSGKTIVDSIVDFGEKVNPDEVRLVTPWETEVPCVCEPFSETAIRLLFKTRLRIQENKPFLVYWGNPAAKKPVVETVLQMWENGEDLRIANGVLDLTFDKTHRTEGLLKHLRVIASQTPDELYNRATGYAWNGFAFDNGRKIKWSDVQVVADNPFKKQVRFDSDNATLDFTVYAEQPRVDYVYTLKNGKNSAGIDLSWKCGDGIGLDEIYYRGLSGKVLALRAALDGATDCIPNPEYRPAKWFSEGWYAISDKVQRETVGHLFDRASLHYIRYRGAKDSGEGFVMTFNHVPRKGEATRGSGSLVAILGDKDEVSNEYRRWIKPPRVFAGAAESVRDIPYRRPRLDHDFCADYNIGKDSGMGWDSGRPLEGTEWCSNIVDHVRELGANGIRTGGYFWNDLPISEALYREIAPYRLPPYMKDDKRALPSWKEGLWTGRDLKRYCEAAHAKGLFMSLWNGFLAHVNEGLGWDDAANRTDQKLQLLYADCGADVVFNARACREGIDTPNELLQKYGRNFWEWKDPQPFFDWEAKRTAYIKDFYRAAKKAYPDKPVIAFNSERSETHRETMLTDQVGAFDTVYCEIGPHFGTSHTKHVAKRLRALFDNEAGRTVNHHFYYYSHSNRYRIIEVERPFIFGMNGFSFENLTYGGFAREQPEIIADAYRFLEYTKLGDKVARMGSVKNLAVFRDNKAYVADVMNRRVGKPNRAMTRQDGRVNGFAEIPNYAYDIVVDPFFKAKNLAKYRVVYVPEDEAFSAQDAKELIAYVKAGGGAVLEGVIGDQGEDALATGRDTVCGKGVPALASLNLMPNVVTPLGKGKIVWQKEVLTDRLFKRDAKAIAEVKALVASAGGIEPYEVKAANLDSMLQASDEGMFLGVYNNGKAEETGIVTLHCPPLPPASTSFVLDVKRGVRQVITNGTFAVTVAPDQSGFYLIGDDTFTALPKTTEGVWAGPSIASERPAGCKPATGDIVGFVQRRGVELVSTEAKGGKIRRMQEASVSVTAIGCDTFDARAFVKALSGASYLHVLTDGKSSDVAFVECAEPIKAMLARGGTLVFDRVAPGKAAQAFLKEVGVFNPYATVTDKVGDHSGKWAENVSTNHPFFFPRAVHPHWHGLECHKVFAKWDAAKQLAPIVQRQNDAFAVMVVQENVCVKGKVLFNENSRIFSDWYENIASGKRVLSWMIGIDADEHAKKVELLNGGPGEVR